MNDGKRRCPGSRWLLAAAAVLACLCSRCGERYPIELKVEVRGERGLDRAEIEVYVDAPAGPVGQSLPYDTTATIETSGQQLTVRARMADTLAAGRLVVRILRGEDVVADEATEDPLLWLTAVWSPE